jgi:hypothetical protein
LKGNKIEPLLSWDQRGNVEVSKMNTRMIVRQLVKELMQAHLDAEELRKRMRKILKTRRYKDEDDDDPD